ncbi:MAG: bifunctional nuclease family protein [Anaerolineaceae bacterium]|nr:bifunctional nuclease family protein [Anaerolineaceae bacterium]NMC17575.1 bifunctional nuclease family protein [Chloroflexota bacterium]
MTRMVEVVIDSVRVSLTNQQRIVMLRESGRERYLPIWIGPYEAEAITISLQEIEVARPQTHDLLLQSLTKLGARLIRVEVVSLKKDVFYGNLVLELDGKLYDVDARPSDSIALAVRAHVPILVNSEILREAGLTPEVDIQAEVLDVEDEPTPEAESDMESEETSKRLSLFEEFLQNVNLDDVAGDSGTQEDDSAAGEGNQGNQDDKPRS